MNKVKEYLNRDIKEFNVKLLVISGILFLFIVGLISYKTTINNSYALFTDDISGTKTLTFHYDPARTVTFDPDGGTIPEGSKWTGSGNSATKSVTTGLKYGDLPIPTKEGYTFKGWNGKNLFNEEWLLAIQDATYENDHYVFSESNAYNLYGRDGRQLPIETKANTRYAVTIKGYIENNAFIMVANFDGSIQYINFTDTTETRRVFLTESNKSVTKFTITYYSTGTAHISQLQIEEGSTATEYEPYYITEDTKVVQSSNHTLKAIWEPNQ